MDKIQMELFEQLTGLHEIPQGAYNIRANSKKDSRNTTENRPATAPTRRLPVQALPRTPARAQMSIVPSMARLKMPAWLTIFAARVASITGVVLASTENQKLDDKRNPIIHCLLPVLLQALPAPGQASARVSV